MKARTRNRALSVPGTPERRNLDRDGDSRRMPGDGIAGDGGAAAHLQRFAGLFRREG
jgi:hypothetical protein